MKYFSEVITCRSAPPYPLTDALHADAGHPSGDRSEPSQMGDVIGKMRRAVPSMGRVEIDGLCRNDCRIQDEILRGE